MVRILNANRTHARALPRAGWWCLTYLEQWIDSGCRPMKPGAHVRGGEHKIGGRDRVLGRYSCAGIGIVGVRSPRTKSWGILFTALLGWAYWILAGSSAERPNRLEQSSWLRRSCNLLFLMSQCSLSQVMWF